MCESKEEGGRRCAAHTRPGFLRVAEALTADGSVDVPVVVRVDETAIDAVTDHATTPSGVVEVEALADEVAERDLEAAQWLRSCAAVGRNRAASAAAARDEIRRRSLKSALRRIAATRAPRISHERGTPEYRRRMSLYTGEAERRFAAFKEMAEADTSLRAPEGWVERFKETSTHSPALPTDRVTGYALWRTKSRGRDFAPADYDPDMCTNVIGSPLNWRAGDVIDKPGFRDHTAVQFEGKVVASVTPPGEDFKVTFTDGSVARQRDLHSQYSVYRPMTADEKAGLERYNETRRRFEESGAVSGSGSDNRGWYVTDPDTGEQVYEPWYLNAPRRSA